MRGTEKGKPLAVAGIARCAGIGANRVAPLPPAPLLLQLKEWPLVKAILISWCIAFFEYCLQVPANRAGHMSQGGPFTAPQLKVIQVRLRQLVVRPHTSL